MITNYGVLDNNFDVSLANNYDVCYYCLKKHMQNNKITSPILARTELQGNLEGKKVWKNKGASQVVICQKHIEDIAKLMNASEDDE